MAKLYFRYGAMNCGKSTHLLQVAHNYEETDQKVLLLKPAKDTKGDQLVVSRIGASRKVDVLVGENDDILEIVGNNINVNCILVDESQFLTPEQVDSLYYTTKLLDIPVICYGLRCDFQMKGFPGSTRLLEIADDLEEMKTICTCGKKATQNMRFINGIPVFEGDQVVIDNGENNVSYKAVCGKCYIKKKLYLPR